MRKWSRRARPWLRGCAGASLSAAMVAGQCSASAADAAGDWADATVSPAPLDEASADPLERAALARCGRAEAGLQTTARAVAARRAENLPVLDAGALAAMQRAAGEPHPWARAWTASARGPAGDEALRALDRWLDDGHDGRLRRCGVASVPVADGSRILAVVAVDALADLASLPIRGRTGQWMSVDARLRIPASGGNVFVIGPNGAPRRMPTWFDGHALHARFALDRPGAFAVQVVATTGSGPRPVLEAAVFADVAPSSVARDPVAPGEDAGEGPNPVDDEGTASSDDASLTRMLAKARAWGGERRLVRDRLLDAVALHHAEAMAAARAVAHDSGDGDPSARLRAAGVDARLAGENAAHAATVTLAHRALWASPAHRANILRRDFDRVGIAVVRDARGEAWVVETFASAPY